MRKITIIIDDVTGKKDIYLEGVVDEEGEFKIMVMESGLHTATVSGWVTDDNTAPLASA
jgi:hypothetical protein